MTSIGTQDAFTPSGQITSGSQHGQTLFHWLTCEDVSPLASLKMEGLKGLTEDELPAQNLGVHPSHVVVIEEDTI